ncbi:C40 family peptidase [Nocardioides cavernaquae]|uniref:C40 family peptidase n=1 Tax=Nocardioides cavernaquae TaxID=2321396 RepID=UPI0016025CFF|nr:C40 family peptidase [Nocardioides cavernaquae]
MGRINSGRTAAIAALVALAIGGATLPAMADPDDAPSQEQVDAARRAVDAKAHSVEGIQAALAAANDRVEAAQTDAAIAGEAYNGAVWHLETAQAAATKAEAESAKAEQKLSGHKVAYTDLIANTYEEQPQLHALSALTTQAGVQDVIDAASTTYQLSTAMDDIQVGYKKAAAAADKASDRAEAARAEAAARATEAKAAHDRAQSAADYAAAEASRVDQQRTRMVAELAQLQNISVDLASRRQAAIEEARREAAAAAAAKAAQAAQAAADKAAAAAAAEAAKKAAQQAEQADQNDEPSAPAPEPAPSQPDPTPPAPGGGAQAAIAYAKAQLGEPYLWAADGPDSWDCSGLTMKAWGAGGKYLPHYSVAQYDQSTPISLSQIAPGDLLFWSSNGRASGIHHVALYMGGGQYIHAPRAGKNVEIKSLSYWYPTMAARP